MAPLKNKPFPHTASTTAPTRPPRSSLRPVHNKSASVISAAGLASVRRAITIFRRRRLESDMSLAEQRSAQRIINELFPTTAPAHLAHIHAPSHRRAHSSPGRTATIRHKLAAGIEAQPAHSTPGIAALDLARVSSQPVWPLPNMLDLDRPILAHDSASEVAASDGLTAVVPPPEVRIIKPSIPPAQPHPKPFATVVAMMEEGDSPTRRRARDSRQERGVMEGRSQRKRRQFIAPIVKIASKDSLARLSRKASDLFSPTSATSFLRPAPPIPTPTWSPSRYAPSSSRQPSPSPRQGPPSFAPGDCDIVEIPRFKKRELNLAIVQGSGPWRAAWVALWAWWLFNGLFSLFFDVNVIFILVQCAVHPSFGSSSSKSWTFAACAYAICWGLSVIAVWLGWELGYEWWRRWRLPRPAMEPMYLSLPASLHLSLTSYHHFIFLAHIRLSPLGTDHALDVVPEACHAMVQLLPGLLPLLPRAAIAVVVLISFSDPRGNVQTPFGATDQAQFRDDNFFQVSGQLTRYATAVLYAFVALVGVRSLIVIASGLGLWMFSRRPLGSLVGDRTQRAPVAPRKPKSSLPVHDPSNANSPQKSWQSAENDFDWAWKDRTRARIQDAFELCMIRKATFLNTSTPWGVRSVSSLPMERRSQTPRPMPADQPLATPISVVPLRAEPSLEPPRPESGVIPVQNLTPPVSRGITSFVNASSSTQDVFYTPRAGSTASVTEFGARRRSHESAESEDSVTDDSAALLSDGSRHSRENSASDHSHSSSRRNSTTSGSRRNSTSGKVLARARSTSVSLLRESLNNGLVKRARSGTMLSAESRYTEIDAVELASATLPRRRSRLGLGSGRPLAVPDMRSTTT